MTLLSRGVTPHPPIRLELAARGAFMEAMVRINRRSLLAGVLIATAPPGWAAAAPASSWLAYERRLRARLADAGGGAFQPAFAQALLRQNNGFRRSERMAPYLWDEGLAVAARAHAADMVGRGFFSHETPEGFSPFDRASLLARDLCGPIAENLAWRDYPFEPFSARHFEDLWETSPGHRRNLLHEDCTHAGYAVVKVGTKLYAAGLYGGAAIRLARPLPLRFKDGTELAAALAGASPRIERLALTHPGENPTRIAEPLATPALTPGVWQLRPMKETSPRSYDVLTGPVFFVG
jgi:uncharacterized protein YkwD